jgi:hypothetical protein
MPNNRLVDGRFQTPSRSDSTAAAGLSRSHLYWLDQEHLNLFAKLKAWLRIATRYDRCAHTFCSAIYLSATMIFWLWDLTIDEIGQI